MPLPLEGLRVVDLSQVWAMPGAAMYLADQGADVIKIEPPDGDDARRMPTTKYLGAETPSFLVVNRNKRGIAVDIRSEGGREIIYRLIKTADVFLVNFRPGVAERLGYGFEVARKLNGRIVYVSATPYGDRGPWAQRRGYDLLFQGLSGQMGRNRLPTGQPMLGGRWTVDTAGSMALAYGVMLGLYQRNLTGQAQRIDCAMLGISLALHSVGMVKAYDDTSGGHAVSPLSNTMHRCADGGWLIMILIRYEDWRTLCRVLGIDHFSTPEAFNATRVDPTFQADVSQVIAGVFETRPRDEWLDLLLAEDFPVAPVLDPHEAIDHPHLNEAGMFVEVEHPTKGRLKMFASPIRLSGQAPQVRRPAPLFGQHTDEVLAELGYSPEERVRLRSEGAVL